MSFAVIPAAPPEAEAEEGDDDGVLLAAELATDDRAVVPALCEGGDDAAVEPPADEPPPPPPWLVRTAISPASSRIATPAAIQMPGLRRRRPSAAGRACGGAEGRGAAT